MMMPKATKKNWDNRDLLGIQNRKQMSDFLGLNKSYINKLIRVVDKRKKLNIENYNNFQTQTIDLISTLPKPEQKPIIEKIKKEEIRPSDVQKIVSEIKKLPSDIKTELMKPNVKITQERLEEARETAKLPNDIRKEVLKPKSKITLEEAKEVAKSLKMSRKKVV